MFSNEKIIETKTCKHCNVSFPITDKDLEFYEKVSPSFKTPPNLPLSGEEYKTLLPPDKGDGGGYKYLIPSPTLCPDCRRQRRLSWRNESKLYKNKCNATGKDIVSIYSPDKKFTIYNQDYWWSDNWNPLDYGKDFDFSKSFFEQFKELQIEVPRIALLNGFQENAEFANHSYHNKNSYLVNSCSYVEDSYHCVNVIYANNVLDSYNSEYCNNSYELIDSKYCNNCFYLLKCHNCFGCSFCEDCVDCKNCIGCKGLHHKEYCVFNKQVKKEEFEKIIKSIFTGENKKSIENEYQKIKKSFPSKGETNLNSTEIIACDNCENSKNLKYCFECRDSENLAYCFWMGGGGAKDCYDYDIWGEKSSLIYETHCSGGATTNILFSNIIWGGHHNIYCDLFLSSASNCFGCIGLHGNEQYCILNKQYSKEEYETLVPKIIEHMMKTKEWGEFFPSSISPFGYNETIANEWFPLTREEAINKNFKWSDYEPPFPHVDKIIPSNKLPKDITKIPDDILNRAIECEITKKPFRIIKQELEFYRKHNLPIPKRHPDQRHLDRMKLRNPRKLFDRKCDKCGKDIKTTYSPDRKEIVYCEECYNIEIY
ncbi:MAG: hypothetical protein PHE25_00750 [Candidatus Gracilibacteria bacterium]|nr:hypothetical protein [Candidatus Gracilibacteria bacterium]